jgi:tripartite-type tricarboxylate transporter receptor subunit TctC
MLQRRGFSLAMLACGCGAAGAPRAQAWPDKPVRFVLSQPAGSGPDNVARLLGDRLAQRWHQAVLIDNRPGGQNLIGAQAAARAPADGSSFYFATTAALVTNAYLFKQLPYDPVKDFVPVALVARSPFGVLVNGASPLRTLADLTARAKAEPGKVSLGNEGPRTFGGMIARLMAARLGLEFNQVPYASVGVAVQNTLGGQVDALVADLPSTASLVKSGRLRLLAVTTAQRVRGFESVPALAESLPGFEMVGWFAVAAPTGTPQPVLQRANADINALLLDPELAERIAAIGPLADGNLSLEQCAAFLRAEHVRWAAATREIGLLPE